MDNMRREFIVNVSHEAEKRRSRVDTGLCGGGLTAGVADEIPSDRNFTATKSADEADRMNSWSCSF